MTPKLLNYPFLSVGGPILFMGKQPYPVSGRAALPISIGVSPAHNPEPTSLCRLCSTASA